MTVLAGIDFGAKKAGTTAIAIASVDSLVKLISSEKGADADQFLLTIFDQFQPTIVAIDAPLSLPEKLVNKEWEGSYHYRQCDQELSAMSPMFLGGLTARAIELKNILEKLDVKVFETYPKVVAKRFLLPDSEYKKGSLEKVYGILMKRFVLSVEDSPATWHELDALLALDVARRFSTGEVHSVGDEREGLIYI